jgi:hypothetical protein
LCDWCRRRKKRFGDDENCKTVKILGGGWNGIAGDVIVLIKLLLMVNGGGATANKGISYNSKTKAWSNLS